MIGQLRERQTGAVDRGEVLAHPRGRLAGRGQIAVLGRPSVIKLDLALCARPEIEVAERYRVEVAESKSNLAKKAPLLDRGDGSHPRFAAAAMLHRRGPALLDLLR